MDHLLAKVMVEIHSSLTLSVHEISLASASAIGQLEESDEWDCLMTNIRKAILDFRKSVKTTLRRVHSIVELQADAKFNIEAFIDGDSKIVSAVTGITDFPGDCKRNLSDIVALLGSEADNKIDQWNQEKTIKVKAYYTRPSSLMWRQKPAMWSLSY